MKRTLIRLGLTALISSALFGCGGGSDGVSGSNSVVQVSPSTPASTIATNASTPTSASVQAWRALEPKVTVTGVTINGPPVVSFAVTDANGAAVVGLGNRSQGTSGSSASVSALTNLSFTFAKLVPATASAPSKWVSYLVLKPTTNDQADPTKTIAATESCTSDRKWCATYPTTDKEGTLVDNGDGTYKYTFARDIKQVASIVAGLTDTVATSTVGAKLKADLGDLTYDPSLTHRVGIIISGAAPGTGSNVPNATTVIPGVNIAIAGNQFYDFRPDGGTVSSTRNIVDIASCASCHNGKGLAHGGSRKDPNLCVTCHTEQVKYGMSGEAKRDATDPTLLTGTIQNETSVLDGRAIGNYPNLIHKFHMGDKLALRGYNYIPNSSGVGVQFEKDEWIQDPRDCTKCHNGSYDPTTGVTDPVLLAAATAAKLNIAKITKDGDNWKNKPSRLACGACHDDLSFTPTDAEIAAGTTANGLIAHKGGRATDDSGCASCHAVNSAAVAPIDVAHRAEAPTANNPVQISGIATISYEIKSVTLNSAKQPVIVFKIVKNGVPLQVGDFADPTPFLLQSPSAGTFNVYTSFNKDFAASQAIYQPIPGFVGGPTFYVAYAVPQDGIAAPADFNAYQSVALANLLVTNPSITLGGTAIGGPKAGTLVNDTGGYMKATLTGNLTGQVASTGSATTPVTTYACAKGSSNPTGFCVNPSPIVIPTTAKMVTGAMIGNFNQVVFPTSTATAGTQVAVDTTSVLGAKYNSAVRLDATNTSTNFPSGVPYYENATTTPGLIVKTALQKLVASGITGNAARRVVVDSNKCNSCHEQLGTAVEFHGGARNDATACAICHNTSRTSSGWSANASTFIHGIHAGTDPVTVSAVTGTGGSGIANVGNPGSGSGGAGTGYSSGKRTIPFSWHRDQLPSVAGGFNAAATVYPGILKRCDNCHVPNAVNFGINGATLFPNLLWSTSATGKYNAAGDTVKAYPRDPVTGLVKYFTADNVVNYGNLFSFTPAGSVVPKITTAAGSNNSNALTIAGSGGVIIPADTATLVESPVTAACFACHDSSTAKSHFTTYGGVFYSPRGSATLVNNETCLICHGYGRDQDAAVVHAK